MGYDVPTTVVTIVRSFDKFHFPFSSTILLHSDPLRKFIWHYFLLYCHMETVNSVCVRNCFNLRRFNKFKVNEVQRKWVTV